MRDRTPDITVDELVQGAFERAFTAMVKCFVITGIPHCEDHIAEMRTWSPTVDIYSNAECVTAV